jgi:AcrR family transcriptional regulator
MGSLREATSAKPTHDGDTRGPSSAHTDIDVSESNETPKPTRERILDVALDLFTEQGYDQTSLREIAEQLGFTKAALYYHFASKEAIFMALHLRLHAIAGGSGALLGQAPITIESWGVLLDSFIEKIPPKNTRTSRLSCASPSLIRRSR